MKCDPKPVPGTVGSVGVRLVALDLDQTLFGTDLVISPRVKAAIATAQAKGTRVTIATGREAKLAARFGRELGLTTPLITAQGACIYDHVRETVLHDVRLKPELLPRILDAAKRHSWNIHFEMFDRLFFPAQSNHPPALFELLRYSNWARVGDLIRDMPEPPHKVIVTLARTEDRPRIVSEMRKALGKELTIVPSHPHLVEGLPAGVNKGRGLAWLANHLGVKRTQVLAIGDSEADVPMLEWAGVGVAMGNGSPTARAAANWVAPPLNQDGAAVALERFVGTLTFPQPLVASGRAQGTERRGR